MEICTHWNGWRGCVFPYCDKAGECNVRGIEHMRHLAPAEQAALHNALRNSSRPVEYGDDTRWSQGYSRGGAPDHVREPTHPYLSDTLSRAWAVMTAALWGTVGFVVGAAVMLIVRG